jgi:hypothetical protein
MRVFDELVCAGCDAPADEVEQCGEASMRVTGARPAKAQLVDGQVVAKPGRGFEVDDDPLWRYEDGDFDTVWFRCRVCDLKADSVQDVVQRRVEWELGDRFNLPDGRTARVMGVRREDRRESWLARACPVTEVLLDGEWWDVRDHRIEQWTPNPQQLELLAVAA